MRGVNSYPQNPKNNSDFPNKREIADFRGKRRFPRRREIGRFGGGAILKREPPPVDAISRFSDPVFAGNPLYETRRRRQKTHRRNLIDAPKSRFPDFPNNLSGNRRFSLHRKSGDVWVGQLSNAVMPLTPDLSGPYTHTHPHPNAESV